MQIAKIALLKKCLIVSNNPATLPKCPKGSIGRDFDIFGGRK